MTLPHRVNYRVSDPSPPPPVETPQFALYSDPTSQHYLYPTQHAISSPTGTDGLSYFPNHDGGISQQRRSSDSSDQLAPDLATQNPAYNKAYRTYALSHLAEKDPLRFCALSPDELTPKFREIQQRYIAEHMRWTACLILSYFKDNYASHLPPEAQNWRIPRLNELSIQPDSSSPCSFEEQVVKDIHGRKHRRGSTSTSCPSTPATPSSAPSFSFLEPPAISTNPFTNPFIGEFSSSFDTSEQSVQLDPVDDTDCPFSTYF
ncbi:hypothetical protein P9112_004542 [Eukaryota sp. TZLM1-RC]